MLKEKSGVGKPEKLISDRLGNKGVILNAPNNGTKSSLLAMESLKYMGKRNGLLSGSHKG